MKHLFALAAVLFLTFAATSAPSVSAGGLQDPAGDGLNSCSVEDCKTCNKNGLMCTPTENGCNCDYWDQID